MPPPSPGKAPCLSLRLRSRVRPQGWSLIELLVVIGLLTVLVVLGTSSMGALRRQSAAARCAGNLRQIGVGLSLYAQDRGVFPYYIEGSTRWCDGRDDPRSFFAGPYLNVTSRAKRFSPTKTETARHGLFDCPAITTEDKAGLGPDEWIEDYFDYGLNISLCGRTPASIATPSRTVAVVEGGNYARVKAQHTAGLTYTPNEPSNPGGTAWNWPTTHSGPSPILYPKNKRACFLFLDGHVSLHGMAEIDESWFNGKQ